MKKYLVEFIGTFFLVFVIGLCVLFPSGAGNLAPLAIGSILAVMVYAGGHISGAHYNPAVTLAVFLRGKCSAKDVPYYMGAQVIAGIAASIIVKLLKGGPVSPAVINIPAVMIVEILFTFALAFVVLNVATASKTAGNSYFGLAIGFTVMAGAFAAGNISGGVFNPAVAVGITVMGLSSLSNLWVFFAANFIGGALAAVVYKTVNERG